MIFTTTTKIVAYETINTRPTRWRRADVVRANRLRRTPTIQCSAFVKICTCGISSPHVIKWTRRAGGRCSYVICTVCEGIATSVVCKAFVDVFTPRSTSSVIIRGTRATGWRGSDVVRAICKRVAASVVCKAFIDVYAGGISGSIEPPRAGTTRGWHVGERIGSAIRARVTSSIIHGANVKINTASGSSSVVTGGTGGAVRRSANVICAVREGITAAIIRKTFVDICAGFDVWVSLCTGWTGRACVGCCQLVYASCGASSVVGGTFVHV